MQAFSYLVEPFKYHVFLSFRGKDTRFTFTGNLYRALRDRGFCVFMDDQRIDKGEKISQELPKAIEESRIYIIVLSENFASSRYCLVEVVMILDEFAKGKGRWIVPVFFYVDPSVLLRTYEPALANQKKWSSDDKIEEWRTALTKLSKFPGFCVSRDGNIFEYQHIDEIVKEVSRHVLCPIGLDEKIFKVNLLLSSGSDGVRMIGICGEAGIGKITLAHEVFHFNADKVFDHCLLFYDVGGISNQSGILSILHGKRVFIIFQDIKHFKQLEDIRELTKQLGSGSKVIITAQDKHLLDRCGIGFESIYEIKRFSDSEADQFLKFKVLNSATVSPKYVNILNRIKSYALGHPWTLEVMCSNLSGKSIEECESALLKYESITDRDIQKILEVSFSALEKCQQQMLIHIALYLKEQKLVDVEAELCNKYKVCPRLDIRVLLDKSLIKINHHGQVTLHTSTQEMIKDKASRFEEYGNQETQFVSNDGSGDWDPMELD
ncbi:hypothetical protein AAZX31_13G177100 [Glycine max]|nr:hypothetical protein JHK84_037121 [Glycine max]KAH1217470.1 TMV resistance protein N [Glycine max]